MQGAERTMGHLPSEIIEQSHARDLQLILRTAHSFLAYHRTYIEQGRSLRILDLALLTAIADLQQLQEPPTMPRVPNGW